MRAAKVARLEAVESASLADLARGGVLSFGDGYRTKRSELGSSGFPILRVAQVADGFVRPTSSLEYVREEFRRVIGPKLSRTDDVVLTTKGTFGRRAYVRPEDADYVYSPQVCWLRVVDRARIDPRYLYSWLGSSDFTNQAHGMKSSTDMADYLSLGDLARVNVPLPPLPEQRAIAHVLGTLDDKIELNRHTNETLEAIARALFKSWFVDFDPVRAKSEGRDPGLPPHLADLFPDSFEDSELGEIPTGWRVMPLPEIMDVNPRRPLRKGEVAPYLDMANMPTRGHSPDAVVDRPFGSGMRFENGDTLVARITPCLENGKTAYVDFLAGDQVGWGSTEYIVLRPKAPLPTEFAYCLARSDGFRDFAIQSMTGSSGRQRVPAESLSHCVVASPPKDVAQLFGLVIQPLFVRVSATSREARTLAALRDTLLPKLISGEYRVQDTERILGAAV